MENVMGGVVVPTMEQVALAVKKSWGWFLAVGIIMIVLGTAAIIVPYAATIAAEVLIGWLFLFGGIAQFIEAITSRKCGGFWSKLIGAILYLAAGVILLFYPLQGEVTLTFVIAILFIVGGFFRVITAGELRRLRGWGWLIFSAIVTIALGLVIMAGWPGDAAWAIGLLVGIDLVFMGWWMVMFAFGIKSSGTST